MVEFNTENSLALKSKTLEAALLEVFMLLRMHETYVVGSGQQPDFQPRLNYSVAESSIGTEISMSCNLPVISEIDDEGNLQLRASDYVPAIS